MPYTRMPSILLLNQQDGIVVGEKLFLDCSQACPGIWRCRPFCIPDALVLRLHSRVYEGDIPTPYTLTPTFLMEMLQTRLATFLVRASLLITKSCAP
jgi:hypothetical protein